MIGRVVRATKQTHSSSMNHNPIIIALDVDSAAEARHLVSQIGDSVEFYKVGMELYAAAGMGIVNSLMDNGKQVFLI